MVISNSQRKILTKQVFNNLHKHFEEDSQKHELTRYGVRSDSKNISKCKEAADTETKHVCLIKIGVDKFKTGQRGR